MKPNENSCFDYQHSLLVSTPRAVNPTDTLYVRASVHHSTNLTVKNPTRCNSVSKFYYSLFL